jgi:sulfopyruvate decarboxylase subunit beta
MMTMTESVEIISAHRQDAIVIASQSARAPWMKVSQKETLDIAFAGSMSKESSVGLGIALARPERKVIVLSGDGELLMNLGTLVTIANQAPKNFYHFVMQNGVYAFTGGQPTPGGHAVDFAGFAKNAGYAGVYGFDTAHKLSARIGDILSETGPVFVSLQLEPETDLGVSAKGPFPWRPLKEYLHGLRKTLTVPG